MIARTLAALAVLTLTGAALAAELAPGDKAPRLDAVEWLQGAPIPEYEPGRIYVLDFWATWCGPCRASIPHINELSKKLADKVTFVGVAISPRPGQEPTAQFVADKGDDMAYPIAEDIDGATSRAFMDATGSQGIPTAMIIDGEGTLAWVGHPMDGMDAVLDQVIAGEFDIASYAAEKKREQALMEAAQKKFVELGMARQQGNWGEVERLANEIYEMGPMFASMRMNRYEALVHLGRGEQAAALGREIVDNSGKQEAPMLNALAWSIVAEDGSYSDEQRDLELALYAARKANKLTEAKEPAVLDTLARVYFVKGDVASAVKTQQQAVGLASGDMKQAMSQTLAEYQAALG